MGKVHHAVVNDRTVLVYTRPHPPCPDQLQPMHVVSIHRGQRTESMPVVRSTPLQPISRVRLEEHLVCHGSEVPILQYLCRTG